MVIIYGKEDCTFCKQAIALAESYNIAYEYRDVSEWRQTFRKQFPEAKTVPQVMWYDQVIGGYREFVTEIENTIGGYGDGTI